MTLLSLIKENTNKASFVKLIGANPIFNTCSKRELVNTFKGGQYLDYDEGQVLFSKGDCPQYVFLIESGGFKVVKDAETNKEALVRFVGNETFVGIEDALKEQKYSKSASCVISAKVYLIPKEPFLNLIYSNITCFNGIIDQLTKDLVFIRQRIVSLAQKNTSQRLAEALLLLNGFFGMDALKQIKTNVSPGDLTIIIGTTRGNLYKQLTLFESMGLIIYKNNNLALLDVKKLTRIADVDFSL